MPTMLQASGAALASRLLLLLAGVGSSVLLPLVVDQATVGRFFAIQIAIAGLSIAAQLGLGLTIPMAVTGAVSAGDLGRAHRAVIRIATISTLATSTVGAASFLLFAQAARHLGTEGAEDWLRIAAVASATIAFTGQASVVVELLRATHAYRSASNLRAAAGSFTAFYLILVLTTGGETTLENVLLAGAAGWALCTLSGGALLVRRIRSWPRTFVTPAPGTGTLIRTTLPNLLTSVVLFALAQFDIVLLSLLAEPEAVAVYGVALRISSVLVIPLAVANAALAPIAVEMRTRGKLRELQRILMQVAAVCTALALVPYIGLAAFGPWLIETWHPEYEAAYGLVMILGLGQVVHAACGAAGMLLMTGGDQGAAMRITLATGVMTVAACVLGLHLAGTTGLAAGAALGNVAQVVCFSWRVRRRFSLEPTLLPLLGSRRGT